MDFRHARSQAGGDGWPKVASGTAMSARHAAMRFMGTLGFGDAFDRTRAAVCPCYASVRARLRAAQIRLRGSTRAPTERTAAAVTRLPASRRERGAAARARRRAMGLLLRRQAHDALLAARADRQGERRAAAHRVAAPASRSRDHRCEPRPHRVEPLHGHADLRRRHPVHPERLRPRRGDRSEDRAHALDAEAAHRRDPKGCRR